MEHLHLFTMTSLSYIFHNYWTMISHDKSCHPINFRNADFWSYLSISQLWLLRMDRESCDVNWTYPFWHMLRIENHCPRTFLHQRLPTLASGSLGDPDLYRIWWSWELLTPVTGPNTVPEDFTINTTFYEDPLHQSPSIFSMFHDGSYLMQALLLRVLWSQPAWARELFSASCPFFQISANNAHSWTRILIWDLDSFLVKISLWRNFSPPSELNFFLVDLSTESENVKLFVSLVHDELMPRRSHD